MPKSKKPKIILLGILTVILLFTGFQYYKFMSLGVYEWDDNMIEKDGIIYEDNPEMLIEYLDGDLKAGETIGRFKDDGFLGSKSWVIKFEGIDEKDAFLVKGLIFDGVYSKSSLK